ncbi:MAG: HEAT repeat domain-containing protein, partial [Methanoregulaceae archaeon]|nr:HEAT repeat domain-containing protein [Methanoregulaceae archaeon]
MECRSPDDPDEQPSIEKRLREQLIKSANEAKDPSVRAYAALKLGEYADGEDIEVLARLVEDEDKSVRAAAARAISMGGESSIPVLTRLMGHPDWRVRYRAVEALGFIGSPRVKDTLVKSLRDDRDHVRYMAAKGLREMC